MDRQITEVLRVLLLNSEVLNDEIMRLCRSGQFTPTGQCMQLIEQIRGSCICSLKNLRSVERLLKVQKLSISTQNPAEIVPLHNKPLG